MNIYGIKAHDTIALRQKILRPDLSLLQCHYPGDTDSSTHHFGCTINDGLVGIVSVYKRSNKDLNSGCGFQIRAMATSENVRGKGVGLKLLESAQNLASKSGADYIWANARSTAIGFYKKAGYTVFGEEFSVQGVGAHFLVFKKF